MHGNMNVKLVW